MLRISNARPAKDTMRSHPNRQPRDRTPRALPSRKARGPGPGRVRARRGRPTPSLPGPPRGASRTCAQERPRHRNNGRQTRASRSPAFQRASTDGGAPCRVSCASVRCRSAWSRGLDAEAEVSCEPSTRVCRAPSSPFAGEPSGPGRTRRRSATVLVSSRRDTTTVDSASLDSQGSTREYPWKPASPVRRERRGIQQSAVASVSVRSGRRGSAGHIRDQRGYARTAAGSLREVGPARRA